MEALSIKEIAEAVGGNILCGDENIQITCVSTNSKNMEERALFIPIVGERVDAHEYIESAFSNGAVACFTSRHKEMKKDQVYIAVDDTVKALQTLGAFYRNRFNIPVIGVTGSVGKTTTKEMVAATLETKYKVLRTEGNMNSQIGLSLMMFRFDYSHEIAVIEMGISEEGEMAKLSPIARPEVAIITNIGVSHINQLKSKENIRKEKLNIINSFDPNSILYVNGNDELLAEVYKVSKEFKQNSDLGGMLDQKIVKKLINQVDIDLCEDTRLKFENINIIAFGTEGFCDYRAEDIQTIKGETHFTLRTRRLIETNQREQQQNEQQQREQQQNEQQQREQQLETKLDDASQGDGEKIILQVLGLHNVYNALVALAIAAHYHIPASLAKEGLRQYQPIAMRGQIKEVNHMKIIDDSYNASPDSMKSGIQVLLELEGVNRRIAVLADMLELGELSYQCHYEVGVFIAGQKIDEVVTIGTEAANIAKAIREKNNSIQLQSFMKNEEAIVYLHENLKAGDAVLIKGSRSMRTDEIVNALN